MAKERKSRLTFDPLANEPTAKEFYEEYSKFNTNSLWSFTIFGLVCLPAFCTEIQDVTRANTRSVEVTCIFRGLIERNWPFDDIRNLTTPKFGRPCTYNDYNYSMFYDMEPEEALALKDTLPHPKVKECGTAITSKTLKVTAPNFWNSCLSLYYKEMAGIYSTMGSAAGHIIFGIIGDLYGRKMGQWICYCIFTMTIIIFPFTIHYHTIMINYFFKGVGHGGLIMLNYILFIELISSNMRGLFTLYISTFGVVGNIIGTEIKRFTTNGLITWYLFTVPTISLIFYLWYIPESPRWLLSYGKKKKAWDILTSLGSTAAKFDFPPAPKINKLQTLKDNICLLLQTKKFLKTIILLSYIAFVQKYVQFSKSSYVTLKQVKSSSHCFLISVVQVSSFLNVLPPFIIFGRNLAATWMNMSVATCLLASVILDQDTAYYMMNLLALMSVYSMDAILFLFSTEMLPTCVRGTGVGIIMAVGLILMQALVLLLDPWTDMVASPWYENLLCCALAFGAILSLIPLPRITLSTELPDLKRYF